MYPKAQYHQWQRCSLPKLNPQTSALLNEPYNLYYATQGWIMDRVSGASAPGPQTVTGPPSLRPPWIVAQDF